MGIYFPWPKFYGNNSLSYNLQLKTRAGDEKLKSGNRDIKWEIKYFLEDLNKKLLSAGKKLWEEKLLGEINWRKNNGAVC